MYPYLKKGVFILTLIGIVSCVNIEQKPFTFVQLCDPQFGMSGHGKDGKPSLYYENDKESLKQAVIQINELKPDFVIICGDFVNHASDSSFLDFIKIKKQINVPCYLAAGNHDVGRYPNDSTLSVYRKLFGKDYYSFEHKRYQFIFTNSLLWMSNVVNESQKHDDWFKKTLTNKHNFKNKKIVIGHVPMYTETPDEDDHYFNIPKMKRMELLDGFSSNNVVAYLSGHKHEVIINNYNNIQFVTGETTSFHFDNSPLGFRLWKVSKDSIYHQFVPLNQ